MWWIYSLFAALLQVLRNALMKDIGHKMDEYINVWARFTFLLPFAIGISLYHGIPQLQEGFWWNSLWAAISVTLATLALSKALKHSEISIVIAIWKLNIIFLVILGYFTLQESISVGGISAICIVFFGVYLMNIEKTKISFWHPLTHIFTEKGMLFSFISAILIAPAVIFFKKKQNCSRRQ